jgi:uncharacterized membrane protein YbaN (DUF454 family)
VRDDGPVPHPPPFAHRSTTGWRAQLRRTPGGGLFLKVLTFAVGFFFILLGVILAALPGPLTIPPILLGLWIWSREFAWADRLLERAKRSAREAWANARERPVTSAFVTLSGLVAVGIGLYLLNRYQVTTRIQDHLGL